MSISKSVNEFCTENLDIHRYASFDYCYNYFYRKENEYIHDLEKSCSILGFYLASWGMMRGSSFLLQKSYKYFIPLMKYLNQIDINYWSIDVDNYNTENKAILGLYNDIKDIIIENGERDIVLVTKIMLGVFGIMPAFDDYFCKCFKEIDPSKSKFTSVNFNALEVIYDFYLRNNKEIDLLSTKLKTKDFISGKDKHPYTKAKIIDMYGFIEGTKK
jgi:hypothetical protein